MTYDVVVLIEREMSEGDARRVAALHARHEEAVDYHLLVSSHPDRGIRRSDGAAGYQRSPMSPVWPDGSIRPDATATAPRRSAVDLASVIEHSSRQTPRPQATTGSTSPSPTARCCSP